MVHHLINPSTIQFFLKKFQRRSPWQQGNDTAVGHGVTPVPC
jgi:hypothetical protein